jgi:hypothetical protein
MLHLEIFLFKNLKKPKWHEQVWISLKKQIINHFLELMETNVAYECLY